MPIRSRRSSSACSRTMARDLKRREWRREKLREAFMVMDTFEAPAEDSTLDVDHLERCLARLAERERRVVILTFYAEKTATEVGEELGVKEGNVRVIRHRAIERLRTCMTSRDGVAMMAPCQAPIPEATLLDYWARDLADGGEIGPRRGASVRVRRLLGASESAGGTRDRSGDARASGAGLGHCVPCDAQPHAARRRPRAHVSGCAWRNRAVRRLSRRRSRRHRSAG